jgi:hypothetical protein
MRSIALGFLCLAAIGCGEDATVSGVFPSSGFLGRTMRVEVTGDNTSWGDGTGLDFGAGITVSSVSVASPTTLFADIVITETAAAGLRDVIVTGDDGGTLHNAFSLDSPLEVEWQGTPAQGSVVRFTVHNLDFNAPFDDTCTAPSLFGCSDYGNTAIEGPPGTYAAITSVSPYTLTGAMLIDIDATAGDFQVLSGPPTDAPVISPLGASIDIAARTAMPLSNMVTATVATAYESHLYTLDAAANTLTRFSVSTAGAPPTVYVLGPSGHFDDYIDGGDAPNALNEAGGTMYVITDNNSGDSGFSYTLRANALTLTPLAEVDTASDNDTAAGAQAGTHPVLVTGASISADTDVDFYKFTIPASSTMKKVHVITMGGDPNADEAVEIYAKSGGGTGPGTKIGEGDDGYHEDVLSDMAVGAATEVYVKIFVDPKYYDPSQTAYKAVIFLQ